MAHRGMEYQTMSEDRLNDIEIKLAHLDMQFEELNSVVLEQNALIQRLRNKIQQIEEERDSEGEDKGLTPTQIAARDKPPHY